MNLLNSVFFVSTKRGKKEGKKKGGIKIKYIKVCFFACYMLHLAINRYAIKNKSVASEKFLPATLPATFGFLQKMVISKTYKVITKTYDHK